MIMRKILSMLIFYSIENFDALEPDSVDELARNSIMQKRKKLDFRK